MTDTAQIHKHLSGIQEPHLGADIVTAGVVADVQIQDGGAPATDVAEITLSFPYPARSAFTAIAEQATAALAAAGVTARFSMRVNVLPRTVQGGVERLPGVRNVIAVASAKGGVGKSTTAANLALALAQEGAQVGVLDADIYGPSLPVMLGVEGKKPSANDAGKIEPITAAGLQLMSIGFLVGSDQPMVWRGPMATRALGQLLRDTAWRNVDYLILDMPPGTGDIQLSIAQQIPVTGAVVVTTPQELAVADARRGIVMFGKVSIPVLGVVENMSFYLCPKCGHRDEIFGGGGGERLCKEFDTEYLGGLPLDTAIRHAADNGAPTVSSAPDSDSAKIYRQIAVRTAVKLNEKSHDRSTKFPKIVINE